MRKLGLVGVFTLIAIAIFILFHFDLLPTDHCITDSETGYQRCEKLGAAYLLWNRVAAFSIDTNIVIAIATVMISVFTYTLWRSTDKLWRAGERQLAHSERQARAFVHVSAKKLKDIRSGERPDLLVTLHNSGSTPALNLRTWCRIYLLDLPLTSPPEFKFEILGRGSRSILPPGAKTGIGDDDFPELTEAQVIEIAFGKKRFWVCGRVLYNDVFGKECWTTFKFHSYGAPYAPDASMNLRWSGDGNEADQSKNRHENNSQQS